MAVRVRVRRRSPQILGRPRGVRCWKHLPTTGHPPPPPGQKGQGGIRSARFPRRPGSGRPDRARVARPERPRRYGLKAAAVPTPPVVVSMVASPGSLSLCAEVRIFGPETIQKPPTGYRHARNHAHARIHTHTERERRGERGGGEKKYGDPQSVFRMASAASVCQRRSIRGGGVALPPSKIHRRRPVVFHRSGTSIYRKKIDTQKNVPKP